jgi:hypothetical protein
MTLEATIARQLGKLLLTAILNGDDHDNESLNALRVLRQVLTSKNISPDDLIQNLVSPPGYYSEADMLGAYQHGGDDREQQLRANMPAVRPGPSSKWHTMAKFCLDNINRARRRDHEFIQSIEWQTRDPSYVPSERQEPWLNDIYRRLGGPPIN